MYACIYIVICMYSYACISIYTYLNEYEYKHIHISRYLYIYIYKNTYKYFYIIFYHRECSLGMFFIPFRPFTSHTIFFIIGNVLGESSLSPSALSPPSGKTLLSMLNPSSVKEESVLPRYIYK
jgi:hypothetical protein